MKIYLIVIMLWLCCAAIFSGCATKTQYVRITCDLPAPPRLYTGAKCAGNDFVFAKCIIAQKEALLTDYDTLSRVLEACR